MGVTVNLMALPNPKWTYVTDLMFQNKTVIESPLLKQGWGGSVTTINNQQAHGVARREYVAPQLVQYGSVSDLTAGGSNGQKENNSNGGPFNRQNHP